LGAADLERRALAARLPIAQGADLPRALPAPGSVGSDWLRGPTPAGRRRVAAVVGSVRGAAGSARHLTAMIYTHAHLPGSDLELRADVVVIGSGARGAPVAAELASRGKRGAVLEAGSYWWPRDLTQVEYEMFPRLYADTAGRTTQDRGIRGHPGRGGGGSTLHNLSLCARVPAAVLAAWRNEHGWKHLPERVLDALYAE